MKITDYIYSVDMLKTVFREQDSHYAHLSSDGGKKETLIEHTILVQKYFLKLLKVHQLESVIYSLITLLTDDTLIREFVLELFVKSIISHDFGKVNPEFQNIKMNNKINGFKHKLSTKHSIISGYIFTILSELTASKKNIPMEKESLVDYLILSFSYPILKHHSSKLNYIRKDVVYSENIDDLQKFIKFFNNSGDSDFITEINNYVFGNSNLIYENNTINIDKSSLFALLKLNYSLLTASDYYATSHFMSSWESMPDDYGVFTDELKKKIISNIENSESFNKKTYKELNNYKFEFPVETSNINLNILRQNLSVEIIKNIRENINESLFYIEAPTGGGKTNLSMLALAEFIRNDIENDLNTITKVFYVFPFTTLITQTFKSLKKTLGLNNNEIVQIHSKTGFSIKKDDDKYGDQKENIIDYQFVNYPIALLSHIKFFDILKSNRKSVNYLLHRLANSVVIIDELQSYSPKEWDKVIYFINNYAKYFNIKFILMSATLPKIDKLLSSEGKQAEFEKQKFVSLIKNKIKYFSNPNFANRVKFKTDIIENANFNKEKRDEYLKKLWEKIRIESTDYKKNSLDKRVHTIIEFIFKKTASEFIEIANNENKLFDEIFILSGTTLEPRRKEIIAKVKSNEYKNKNILLITTQVIEAGVDIDMDLGFKDISLIDSEEQLAGRINRNVNKPQCKLYLFDLDDAKVIYEKDDRYKKIENELKNEYFEILNNKNFDKVYNSIMEDRKKFNKSDDFINLKDYISAIHKLDFTSVDKDFKLIENDINNITVYVPIEIDINIPNSKERNFTEVEIEFLKENNKFKDGNTTVSGKDVWDLFIDAIKYKDEDFITHKKKMIILKGLMSTFSFSIGAYSKIIKNIQASGNIEELYGYYYLLNAEDVYDYNKGFKKIEFDNINIW